MATGKVEGQKFWARCEQCGQWLEVQPQPVDSSLYFAQWQGSFCCCGLEQTVRFTLEKDEIDFH